MIWTHFRNIMIYIFASLFTAPHKSPFKDPLIWRLKWYIMIYKA